MFFVGPRSQTLGRCSLWEITQSCVVESDTAGYYEPEMTWEVVVVAFKLGSSFFEDRKIKKKIGTDFGKQWVRTQYLGPQDTCFCRHVTLKQKDGGSTDYSLLLRMDAPRMVDKQNLRVKGTTGRPNCRVIKLKITHLQANWEKLDSRPCIALGKGRNTLCWALRDWSVAAPTNGAAVTMEEFLLSFPKIWGPVTFVTGVEKWGGGAIEADANPS